jgi:hypothetical protein
LKNIWNLWWNQIFEVFIFAENAQLIFIK